MVSASRQQMVGHLLKDIVESSEKPSLLCQQDPKYDRFGFKIDEEGSLEEKAERLRRVAQDNWEESELSLEEVWPWLPSPRLESSAWELPVSPGMVPPASELELELSPES